MTPKTTDIAIIGGGLASLAAAVELSSSNLSVTLITKGPGAAALSSGAWAMNTQNLAVSPALSSLQASVPDQDLTKFLVQKTKEVLSALPLPMEGEANQPQLHLTEYGTFKQCDIVQLSQSVGDFLKMQAAKILLVGIPGLPNFRAWFLKQALEERMQRGELPQLELVGHCEIPLPGNFPEANLNPVEVALAFDQEAVLLPWIEKIAEYARHKVYTHLLLPPVLGLKNTSEILKQLQAKTGLRAAEVLATPTSVPGHRLQEAIHQYFKKQNYEIIHAEALAFEAQQDQIKSLTLKREQEIFHLEAKHYILATGKLIGGGIRALQPKKIKDPLEQTFFEESLFRLPLFVEGHAVKDFPKRNFTTEQVMHAQPAFQVGLHINERLQPINGKGQVYFSNLRAAGQILADFDSTRDPAAAGVSIVSGCLAARQIF